MAVLNKIRQRSVFLILVIALALFAFILADLFRNNNAFSSKGQNVVATINGKDIGREDFLKKVETAQRNQPSATQTQLMNSLYEQEVRKAVLETEYEALGLSVERDQMRNQLKTALASMPEFQDENGLFSEDKLNEFIANLKEIDPEFGYLGGQPIDYTSWKNYEEQLATNALQQDYFNLVKAGATATLLEGKAEHVLQSEKRNIRFVQIPFTSIPDSTVSVSKSEMSDYIKEHKSQFEVEASRNLRFVQFAEKASKADEDEIKKAVADLKNDREKYNEDTKETYTETGFANATNVEAFVNANSDEKFVDKFVYKSALPEAVADTIFNLKVGDIYGPYKQDGTFKLSKLMAVEQLADSVKSSHIIVPFAGSMASNAETTMTKEEARTYVDSLLPLVKNNKEKFNEVATEINTDGTKNNNGEVGWTRVSTFNPDAFDPDYADFIFSNKAGAVDIVETRFGYHIIRVDEKKAVAKAVKLATISHKIEPSEDTMNDIFREASNFELALADKDFQAIAEESDLQARPVNQVKELDENLPGLGSQRQIVRWAFEEDTEVGDYKRFDLSGNYVVVQVTAKNKAGLMPVEDASATVLPEIRKEKKAKLIKDRVSANTLNDLATAEGQRVQSAMGVTMKSPTLSGAGNEPLVVGTAFGLEEGQTSNLITGEKGVYMVDVTKVEPAVELDNYQAFANQVQQQKIDVVSSKLYEALKESAEIEDNRAKTVQ